MGMVKVACRQVGGISLRLYRRGWDDGTGVTLNVPVGDAVVLNGPPHQGHSLGIGLSDSNELGVGYTMVDEAWMSEWMEQNKGKNPFVDMGLIEIVPESEA